MATNLKDIADQYAKAIFELSSEQDNVEDTRKDLDTLKVVFENNPNFVTIVSSNDINSEARDGLLTTLTTGASEAI